MPAALTGGYHLGFWIAAVLVLMGAIVALVVLTSDTGSTPSSAELESELDTLSDPSGRASLQSVGVALPRHRPPIHQDQ